jgi:secreted PhoX family phosphatase
MRELQLDRRGVLGAGAAAAAFSGFAQAVRAQTASPAAANSETYVNEVPGYGPLIPDPDGLLDLPEGFTYHVVSQGGETMDDGLLVPGQFDGMGCFPLEGSQVALVRNHELKASSRTHGNWGPGGLNRERLHLLDKTKAYDLDKQGRPLPGGTTTVVYDLQTRKVVRQFLSLAGTSTNCAGGQTPWGTWLTCEECEDTPATTNVSREHGWVFEVPANATGLVDPVPLKAMGRFDHEAVCIDPRSGIVYLTEDKEEGLFYRFIPNVRDRLVEGGKLQALVIKDSPGADTSNNKDRFWAVGDWRDAEWVDLDDVESPNADLRMRGRASGAAIFNSGEGVYWGANELYFTAKYGGPIKRGQLLRYVPSADGDGGRVQLFLESGDEKVWNMGDNLTVAPWGHLIVCEDNYSAQIPNHLKGVTPDGKSYTIARNVFQGNSEFAGCCFSPDASVLFVNIQFPGITIAITGPWDRLIKA